MKEITPRSRRNDLVVQEMDGEILIYNLTENKAFSLNETSALVWELSDGKNSVMEISLKLSLKLKTKVSEELVWLALDQLKKEKLIINEAEIPASYQGINRREVIRKIGLTSMVVLPLVSSLVAPSALNAQSGGACPNPVEGTAINAVCISTCECNQYGNPPGYARCCRTWEVGTVPPASNPLICSGSASFDCQTP